MLLSLTLIPETCCPNSPIRLTALMGIEQRLNTAIFNSRELYGIITMDLQPDDFTYVVNKSIYEYLTQKIDPERLFAAELDKEKVVMDIARSCHIRETQAEKLLDKPIKNKTIVNNYLEDPDSLKWDLHCISTFLKARKKIISEATPQEPVALIVENEHGKNIVDYRNGIIESIQLVSSPIFPTEFCASYSDTLSNFCESAELDDCQMIAELRDGSFSKDYTVKNIRTIVLTKNISMIEKFNKVFEWADKNNISTALIPRDRPLFHIKAYLLDLTKCNIKEIPEELFEARKWYFGIILSDNKLKSIPNNISKIRSICLNISDNELSRLPAGLFEVKDLSLLYLSQNKLKSIPRNISKAKALTVLDLSGNKIKKLPKGISKLKNLKNIYIGDTLIGEDSLEHLNLEIIESISFNDELLPFFAKNIGRLKNINRICLSNSKYEKDDEIIKSLGLRVIGKKRSKEKSIQVGGCIGLKKAEKRGANK